MEKPQWRILENDSFTQASGDGGAWGRKLDQRQECLYLWDSERGQNSQLLHEQMPQILRDMKVELSRGGRQPAGESPLWKAFEKAVLGYGALCEPDPEHEIRGAWRTGWPEGGQLC